MRTFKSFINEAGPNVKPKAKGEADFVAAHKVEISDKESGQNQPNLDVGTKEGSGKRKADKLDNKQNFGEVAVREIKTYKEMIKSIEEVDSHQSKTTMKHINKPTSGEKKAAKDIKPGVAGYRDRVAMLKSAQARGALKKEESELDEADFTKQQTKMAHTIGKEFEKKGVGDESKGGPYAVASAMVRDKPEAAQKAYVTIKAKMKEETSTDILFKLYEDLNEDNQEFFMIKLEEDAEALLDFAISQTDVE